jgi:exodeoxyribonuclease VII large subunit
MDELVFGVSDFVAVLNQTLEFAYPSVVVAGELANFRVSKNRWVYFDLKDEYASVRFFGTVYNLPGPLEDGMLLQVRGNPRLHPLYGFSVNVQSMTPVGEGSLRKAAALLEQKLAAEGLFDESRKRPLPYPPRSIGLITSRESAAYADFTKILGERWGGVEVRLADVQVQGDAAPAQIVRAIEYFNSHAEPPEVLVITRGGGNADDLAAFSTEQVTRAVSASRIPTLVAIGHEVDFSLAELAADQRASTPSNAAQLLVPDKLRELLALEERQAALARALDANLQGLRHTLEQARADLAQRAEDRLAAMAKAIHYDKQMLTLFNPQHILARGYALVHHGDQLVRSATTLQSGDTLRVTLHDGTIDVTVARHKT